MGNRIQAVGGMNDIVPAQSLYWDYVEKTLQNVVLRYGYQEIRFPMIEFTALFKRSIGEATDIVEKEMYTFSDRNGDSLTLRPEGTAGCVRAALEQGLLHNQLQRLWYQGAMFRHETPQRGRYRQFYQFGVEAFGMPGPDIDAEIISMNARMWKELGIADIVTLQLNSLGNAVIRARYRQELINYFNKHQDLLDADSKRRLHTNPLRILDSKNPHMKQLIAEAPKLFDYLDEASQKHFAELQDLLRANNIRYEINPKLVRGLDYYNLTVFEWVTEKLGSQNSICAGGRYDGLVEQLGGNPMPAFGFAIGLERLIELVISIYQPTSTIDAYLIIAGEGAIEKGMQVGEQLRTELPTLKLMTNCGDGSFKSQFKRADKSGAKWALILGDEELSSNTISIKNLRQETEQQRMTFSEIINFLRKSL